MDVTLAGSAITYRPDDDQLAGLSLEFAAFDGEVGVGQVPVPDQSAAISVYDGRQFKVEEGATLLTDGFIIDQDRDRGPVLAADARVHTFSVMDANALLDGFRVERTRPAETDVARVLAFAALDGPTWDTTWVVSANLANLPAKTFSSDGGWTAELIPDLVEYTGKTLFLHDLADGTGRCLHYHTLNSGHTCGLVITDALADLDDTHLAPWGPRRQRTSVDLRNDVKVVDQSGRASTATDATSISRHDADGLQHQSLVTLEAASQADLDVKSAAMLASQKDERDTYTCTIGPLDETALALVRVGDLVTCTSTVWGLTASVQRLAHMSLRPWIGEGGRVVEGYWLAELELGAPVRRRARVANKAVVGRDVIVPPPFTPCIGSTDDETGLESWQYRGAVGTDIPSTAPGSPNSFGAPPFGAVDDPPIFDDLGTPSLPPSVSHFLSYLWIGPTWTGFKVDFLSFLGPANDDDELPTAVRVSGKVRSNNRNHVPHTPIPWELRYGAWGSAEPDVVPLGATLGLDWPAGAVSVASGTGLEDPDGLGLTETYETDTLPLHNGGIQLFLVGTDWPAYAGDPDYGGGNTVGLNMDGTAGVTLEWLYGVSPCNPSEPFVGQTVRVTDIVGDGSTTSFTTDWDYAPGSLRLWVNGLDWTPQVNETSANTYTLDYPLPLGASSVVLEYRRAA